MKKLLLITAMMVLAAPLYAQEDSIDVTNILNGLGGGNNQGGRGGRGNQPVIPDSKQMFLDIEAALKKGKTPLEDPQKKPLQSLLNSEIVALTDQIQLIRNGYENNNQNNQQGRGRGGNNNQQNNQQPSQTAIQVDTITQLKNQDFIDTKLSLFLSPEQVALIKKTAADDKAKNSTCLQGMLDHYYQYVQNPNRGNNNQNNNNQNFNRGGNNQNNNNQNNQTRPNGMKYCMAIEATSSDRLDPIRKVLAKGNMPLAKDKEVLADAMMKAELSELQDAFRKDLTGNNNNNNQGGRGGNQNNRNGNQDPRQLIQKTTDNIYKKVETTLNPQQAETLRDWHYTQILGRGGIEALVAIEALADTPLTDEQVAKVTAAWPEYRKKIQDLAKQTNQSITDKQRDSTAMNRILDDFLEPPQIASYKLAVKYGPETGSK